MVRRVSQRGFTLIEMAIVVVIIGLLLSGGLLAVSPIIQSSKVTDTNARLDRLEQALTVYVIQNGCLPCPADRGMASSNANAGWSDVDGSTNYYGLGKTGGNRARSSSATCFAFAGVVPWNTLGISEADITDAWGNRVAYGVTGALTTDNTSMVRTPPSSYPAGTINVCNTTGSCASPPITTAAYVLVSFGVDMTFANMTTTGTSRTPTGGGQYGYGATDASGRNNPAVHTGVGVAFAQGDYIPLNNQTHFDDLVRFRTVPIIIQSCGTNACGNPS